MLAAAPSAGATKPDMAKLDALRSLIAEAAALEWTQTRGLVTGRYAVELRSDLQGEIGKLTKDPQFGPAARQGLGALQRRDAAGLAALRDWLAALERANGRAD